MNFHGSLSDIRIENFMVLKEYKKAITAWLWSGILLVTLMVVIGGITRITGSGLSMVSWSVISGAIPPLSEAQWMETFEEYKKFPEYRKLNYNMTLSGFKNIFWWEYFHRLLGRIIGIVFILPFIYFLIRKSFSPGVLKGLLFILLLGMCQGLMGWIMVKSGLQDNPHVSHYPLAMHLSLALLLIGSILWLIFKINLATANEQPKIKKSGPGIPILPVVCISLLFVQIILGAFVAGLKAGYSYNTYPLMNDEFLPANVLSYSANIFENGVFIQFIHRWFAWLVTAAVFILWLKSRQQHFPQDGRLYANLMLWVCLLQVSTGIATLVWRVPLFMGVIHQLLAVVLFGLMVIILFYAKYHSLPGPVASPKFSIKKRVYS